MDPMAVFELLRDFNRLRQTVREAKECPSALRGLRREVEVQRGLFLTDCQELFEGFMGNDVNISIETMLQSEDDERSKNANFLEVLDHHPGELKHHLGEFYQPAIRVLKLIDETFRKIKAVFDSCKLPNDSNPGMLKVIEWMRVLPRKEELERLIACDLSKQVGDLQRILWQRRLRNRNLAKEVNESRSLPGVPATNYSDSVIVHIRNSSEQLHRAFSSLGSATRSCHYTDLQLRSLCSDEVRSIISSNPNKASCIEFGFTVSPRPSFVDDSNQPHSSAYTPITVKPQDRSLTETAHLPPLAACNGQSLTGTPRDIRPPNRPNNRITEVSFSGGVSGWTNNLCASLRQTDSPSETECVLGYIPIDGSCRYLVYQGKKITASRVSLDHLLNPPTNAARQREELLRKTYERIMLALALAFSVLDLGIQSSTWFKQGCDSEEIYFFRKKSWRYEEFISSPHIEVIFNAPECEPLEKSTESDSLSDAEKSTLRRLFTSLGIVLVEIGYCNLLENAFKEIVGDRKHDKSDRSEKARAVAGSINIGRKYREIMNDCLSSNFGIDDRKANYVSIRESFYMRVIRKLEELSEFF